MAGLPTGVEIRNERLCIWFMLKGKRCRETLKGWSTTPASIKKAGNLRSLIVSEISLGEFDYRQRFPTSKRCKDFSTTMSARTFGDLCDLWISVKETEISARTMRKTCSQIKTLKYIIHGDTPLSAIRHCDILNYRNQLINGETLYIDNPRSNKQGRTVRTVNSYIALLCGLLRFAHHSGFISHKPFDGVRKLRKTRTRPDPFTRQEIAALLETETGQSRNLWQFAIYSGLRHGELAALAWEDIDLEKGTVHVRRNLNSLKMFVPPKTDAGDRIITLLEPAKQALLAQSALTAGHPATTITLHHRAYGSTENQSVHFVFMPRKQEHVQKPHYSLSSIGARFNAAVKRAGIRRRNPYHTRHTFACWLLSVGANPSFIANQMGHENAQMVYGVYGAWVEELNGSQVQMINSKLAG